jgi:hypothetical protein
MNVNLQGFSGVVQIKDVEGDILYQKDFLSQKEIETFIQQYGKSKQGYSLLQSAFIPLRTQNLKDFFLPAFVNFSLKINNIALKIIASIFAIALDVVSLPIRFFMTPFCIYYNYKNPETEHPVINLIRESPLSQKAIIDNFVHLCYEVQDVQRSDPSAPDEEGNTFQNAAGTAVKGTIQVALRRMPGIVAQSSEEETIASYVGMNGGDWEVENSTKRSSSHYLYAC